MSRPVVIDANLGISLVTPVVYSSWVIQRMDEWRIQRTRIVVPTLWRYEVLSGLRKAISAGFITTESAGLALEQLAAMAFEEIMPTWEASHSILEWAGRIGQMVAYDSVYLALAEQLGADFFTADRRLALAAKRAGINWVFSTD